MRLPLAAAAVLLLLPGPLLAQQGAQESIILERSKLWHGRQSSLEKRYYRIQSPANH